MADDDEEEISPAAPVPQVGQRRLFNKQAGISNAMQDQSSRSSSTQSNQLNQPIQGPSLKQRLFGYSDPTKTDQYGLQMPTKQHEGMLSKILSYALPAITGLAGGVGVLPGLASAFMGEKGGEARGFAKQQDLYNRQLTNALAAKRQEALESIEAGKLGLEGQKLGIESGKAKTEAMKSAAETEEARARAEKLRQKTPLQRATDYLFGSGKDTPTPSATPFTPKGSIPKGATGTALGEDGKKHYHDAQGNDLGLAE